jgi:hypothetical protein
MRRITYGAAIFAATVIGFGLKGYFFSPPIAEAEVVGMDIAMMHAQASAAMPRQELNDRAFGP